jgi:hypothetical protein
MGVAACVNHRCHDRFVECLERDLEMMQLYGKYAKEYAAKDDERRADYWRLAVGKIAIDIIGLDNLSIDPEAKL